MKVLLVKPCWPYPASKNDSTYNRIWPPLCLLNCASLLRRNGIEVKILDAHAERLPHDKIERLAEGFDSIFVTSSSLDRWQCPNMDITPFIESVRSIRMKNDSVYVMGFHGTVDSEKILELTSAKAVIRGEPEETILELCRNKDLSKISGIAYKTAGQVIINQDRVPVNLDALPIPAFDLLDIKKYRYEILGKNLALFEASRGCPHNCKFCNKAMYGRGFRKKTSQKIIEEITHAVIKNNVKTGYFMDLDFTADKNFIEELSNFLVKARYGFKWCCQARVDEVDRDILFKMKRAGCELIHYGAESAVRNSMKEMNKELEFEQVKNAVDLSKQAGIRVACFFILGFPKETPSDAKKTIEFAKKLNPHYASFHRYVDYSDSSCFKSVEADFGSELIRKNACINFYLRPRYFLSKMRNLGLLSFLKEVMFFLRYFRQIGD